MGFLERVVRSGRFFNVFQARIKSVGMPITWAEAILRPTLGYVGLKAGNVGREEGDVSNAWRGAWRYSWPTELGTPVQANSASAGPSGIGRGSRTHQCASPVPFCFVHKQVVAAVVGSPDSRQNPTLLPQPMAKESKRGGEGEEEDVGDVMRMRTWILLCDC